MLQGEQQCTNVPYDHTTHLSRALLFAGTAGHRELPGLHSCEGMSAVAPGLSQKRLLWVDHRHLARIGAQITSG